MEGPSRDVLGWLERRAKAAPPAVSTCVPSSTETVVFLIDSSKRFDPGIGPHIPQLYRGRDFPRNRVLTPDDNPVPVAATGVAQPAGDFVVGNKFVVEPGKPPIVLRHCQDRKTFVDAVILAQRRCCRPGMSPMIC